MREQTVSRYQSFIFEDYVFNSQNKTLTLHYSCDETLRFTESYVFDFDFTDDYSEELLDAALFSLFIMAGVSYYKTFIPPEIVIKKGGLSKSAADFFAKTYQRGLGEFFYVNKLDPKTEILFPVAENSKQAVVVTGKGSGKLVGLGGGKDSLVTVEALRDNVEGIATWSLGHRKQLQPLVDEVSLPHYFIERTWDRQLLELNQQGAYNGHVPISAIFACVGAVVAVLSGKQDIVVSNEQSANEPTLEYEGVAINHQYSKSQEFERDFQSYLQALCGESLRYYSFLRPFSEVKIAEEFAKSGFEKYKGVFSSCNRAFVHTSNEMSWCGECSKCAFVFLALTPFVEHSELEALWGGKNLLLEPALEPTYRQLLGIEGDKPLDCVGEVKESRAAMRLAQRTYPELTDKYSFDIPADYDYAKLGSHEMPEDVYELFKAAFLQ